MKETSRFERKNYKNQTDGQLKALFWFLVDTTKRENDLRVYSFAILKQVSGVCAHGGIGKSMPVGQQGIISWTPIVMRLVPWYNNYITCLIFIKMISIQCISICVPIVCLIYHIPNYVKTLSSIKSVWLIQNTNTHIPKPRNIIYIVISFALHEYFEYINTYISY